jgi:hypothetical protein
LDDVFLSLTGHAVGNGNGAAANQKERTR